jgi:hypothetical protein
MKSVKFAKKSLLIVERQRPIPQNFSNFRTLLHFQIDQPFFLLQQQKVYFCSVVRDSKRPSPLGFNITASQRFRCPRTCCLSAWYDTDQAERFTRNRTWSCCKAWSGGAVLLSFSILVNTVSKIPIYLPAQSGALHPVTYQCFLQRLKWPLKKVRANTPLLFLPLVIRTRLLP